tara:strand:- start:6 stop:1112 length:1107 start_codon:yes stop_codon:yes gene_type:complete
MDKLLKEAIADAKAVRETALANAKIALEEAFTPHLKSMLSKKLQAEMDGEDEEKADEGYHGEEDEEEIDEEMDSSEIGASDNKEPAGEAGDTSGIGQGPESEGSDEEGGKEDENLEKAPDQPVGEGYGMDDEDEDPKEEGAHMDDEDEDMKEAEMEDEDDDVEEVLRQLEAEMNDEDEEPKEEGAHMDDEDEDMKEEMEDEDEEPKEEGAHMDDEDEEIDLDEIIKALTEEEGMEDEDEEEKNEEMEDEDSELEEYKKTVQYLRDKLSEVNLLNAKLLYTNKLFRSRNVSEEQKMKVIEQFDRAGNVREVKLVFTTFAESMKRKPVNESAKRVSQASKPTASTQPKKKPIIGENTDFKSRMKKLANII